MQEMSISSAETFITKFVFPAGWLAGFGLATADLFSSAPRIHWEGGGTPPAWAKWAFLAAFVAGTYMLQRVAMPLKAIRLAGNRLIISNYVRRITVPLKDVARVGLIKDWTVNNRPVGIIEFRTPTPFGTSVTFYPRSEEAYGWLTRLIPEAVANDPPGSPASTA